MKQKYTGRAGGGTRFSAGRKACELQGCGGYVGIVAKSAEPVHVWLLAEPGDLPLGEATRDLLDFFDHFSGRAAVSNLIAQMRVADELKWLCVGGHAHFDKSANFVHPAGGNHGVHARIDFGVEVVSRGREADFGDGV